MSDNHDFFPGFKSGYFSTEQGQVFVRHGGEGPPLLLLHGFPQTHVCWHRLAAKLAKNHHVVMMDLRGYGWSSAPRGDGGREIYSKRAMSRDVVKVMSDLGYPRFALVGHDRGARVGYRLALDHPGRMTHLGLLDILPTVRMWERIESGAVPGAHWTFLSRPQPEPEDAISRNATAFFEKLISGWTHDGTLKAFDWHALQAYRQAANDPARIHAFCEDYRAGATTDRQQDEADLAAGKTIVTPTCVIWGEFYLTGSDDPGSDTALDVWRKSFAPRAQGAGVECGHFLAEENPGDTLAILEPFLAQPTD